MTKNWYFERDSRQYHVQLEMDFTTRREILVNGKRILEDIPFHNFGSYYDFEVDGIVMEIIISRSYFKIKTTKELYVQGERMEATSRKS